METCMLLYFIVPDTCEIDPLSYALSILWYHYYNKKYEQLPNDSSYSYVLHE